MKVIFGKEKISCDSQGSVEEFPLQDINAEKLVALLEKCVSSEPDIKFEAEADVSPFANKLKEIIESAFAQGAESGN